MVKWVHVMLKNECFYCLVEISACSNKMNKKNWRSPRLKCEMVLTQVELVVRYRCFSRCSVCISSVAKAAWCVHVWCVCVCECMLLLIFCCFSSLVVIFFFVLRFVLSCLLSFISFGYAATTLFNSIRLFLHLYWVNWSARSSCMCMFKQQRRKRVNSLSHCMWIRR